jgi:hypothetical protein
LIVSLQVFLTAVGVVINAQKMEKVFHFFLERQETKKREKLLFFLDEAVLLTISWNSVQKQNRAVLLVRLCSRQQTEYCVILYEHSATSEW